MGGPAVIGWEVKQNRAKRQEMHRGEPGRVDSMT